MIDFCLFLIWLKKMDPFLSAQCERSDDNLILLHLGVDNTHMPSGHAPSWQCSIFIIYSLVSPEQPLLGLRHVDKLGHIEVDMEMFKLINKQAKIIIGLNEARSLYYHREQGRTICPGLIFSQSMEPIFSHTIADWLQMKSGRNSPWLSVRYILGEKV